jgi:hypothetical protein
VTGPGIASAERLDNLALKVVPISSLVFSIACCDGPPQFSTAVCKAPYHLSQPQPVDTVYVGGGV